MIQRFVSTRDRIVRLLRQAKRSVNELAGTLRLTDNAIRANLARLQRDGLVQESGQRPSARRPEAMYELTAQAERSFERAYAPVLDAVLSMLESKLPEEQLDAQLREVGRRLAAPHLPALSRLEPRERAQRTLKILAELGGLAELETQGQRLVIRGYGCPLGQLVLEHPKVCLVAEALVSELLGRDARQQCERGERARCCFAVQE